MTPSVPHDIVAALARAGFIEPRVAARRLKRLTGGVSSDIWRVDLRAGPVCVKRALPRLRVAAQLGGAGRAQPLRSGVDAGGGGVVPGAAPRLAHDEAPACSPWSTSTRRRHPLWKTELRAGRADPARRRRSASASRASTPRRPQRRVARRFATDSASTPSAWSPTCCHRRAPPGGRGRLQALAETPPTPARRWCMATSARRTSWSGRTGRCSSTPNAPGTATRPSISRSASTTCC